MIEPAEATREAKEHCRRILIAGGTGFIGGALVRHLISNDRDDTTQVMILTRDPQRAAKSCEFVRHENAIEFISYEDRFPDGLDAVINLAGESIVGFWTRAKRRRIIESRTNVTSQLVQRMGSLSSPPRVFMSASAVGIYGHRPGETLDEDSPLDPNDGFRAQVCRAWEDAARPAEEFIDRVIYLRIGNVMHPSGGYLGSLLRLGRALRTVPVLGDRNALVSWISLDDLVRLIDYSIEELSLSGIVNATAPHPASQQVVAEGAKQLIRSSGNARPARLRIPGSLIRFVVGEFSRAMIDHQHTRPAAAVRAGFVFEDPDFPAFLARIREESPR